MKKIIEIIRSSFKYLMTKSATHMMLAFCINTIVFAFMLFFKDQLYYWQIIMIAFFITNVFFGGAKEIIDLEWNWKDIQMNVLGSLISSIVLFFIISKIT